MNKWKPYVVAGDAINWSRANALTATESGRRASRSIRRMTRAIVVKELAEIDDWIAAADAACQLTDAERERMEAWIAEHYVEEPEEIEF